MVYFVLPSIFSKKGVLSEIVVIYTTDSFCSKSRSLCEDFSENVSLLKRSIVGIFHSVAILYPLNVNVYFIVE